MAQVIGSGKRTSPVKAVQLSDISLAHAQLMHWIIEYKECSGCWPGGEQIQASEVFNLALLKDLQTWNLVAWNEAQQWVAMDEWVRLPVLGSVAAGIPIEAIENQQGQLSMPLSLFREKPTYLLRVRGDSMKEVGILNGDLIAVRKTDTAGEGKIVVARVDNEVTVKRLMFSGDHVALMPENKNYAPILVAPDDLTIEGLFVGVIRGGQTMH